MPNIKMVGYSQKAYSVLKLKIDAALQSLGLGGDAVTTWVPALVMSCDGQQKAMPYLRVCSTGDGRDIVKIIDAFKEFGITEDCEGLLLTGFTPASEMIPSRVEVDGPLGRSDDAHEA